MILEKLQKHRTYYRTRCGKKQKCVIGYTVYILRCDNCGCEFTRTSKVFNRRSSAHVCSDCNQKKFAQKQSSILRQYKKYDASSSKTI
tara:strand:+ start:9090 stop:9353 length:264 start_codon:yes stop_codon:yes gene_type:complete